MIFLDTSFLYALFTEEDVHHARVREVLEKYRGRKVSDMVLTTNHVVAETITLIRKKSHPDPAVRHAQAVVAGKKLFGEVLARIHQVTAEEEQAAFAYFTKHRDKDYSFVDCVSFVVMNDLDIEVAWSVDDDFNHRFTAVPGPLPKGPFSPTRR